ncbi:hypothetical protein [Rathayibacter iranicus]|uniref:Uncharacterized protein n=1 Tax=Rathayibacter iranicus NCPPB 2253 = VKM Ac-1602 TaxID=1328868 RepID=A0ABX5LAV2_9MICO|nr:hypothetical protein [Rathayibacter iranicus]PWJ61553.1 hypothetical protein B0H03_11625 [Rathayibacter iranicus NCPPB 2253 = VKM Ac-1602]
MEFPTSPVANAERGGLSRPRGILGHGLDAEIVVPNWYPNPTNER